MLTHRTVFEARDRSHTPPSKIPNTPQGAPQNDEQSHSSSEEDFADYQTQSISEVALSNITDTIDRLYRVSFQLQNPATGFNVAKNTTPVKRQSGSIDQSMDVD